MTGFRAHRPTLLLLPGLLCDEYVWRPQVAALNDRCEIIVPEFFAFRSIEAMAAYALTLAPGGFALCGHSLGGRIALEMLRQAPQRVERLALLDTGVHPPQEHECKARMALVELAQEQGMATMVRQWLPPMVHPELHPGSEVMTGLFAMVERMTLGIFENQQAALLDRPDGAPLLPGIRCPVLVAAGRQDGWSPPAQHEAMADAIPGAKLRIFEDCGHMSTVEAPAAVCGALADWLVQ